MTAGNGLDGVDLDTLDFLTDPAAVEDPYPYYRHVRESHGPVWIEPLRGVAMVTGLSEALVVYRDPETFSSCNAATGPFPGLPEVPTSDDASELIEQHRSVMPLYGYMATWDAPEHGAYRSLVRQLFTPGRLRAAEPLIRRRAAEELEPLLVAGACEFVADFSSPFAMMVVADLLGVPEADLPQFRRWFASSRVLGDLDVDMVQERARAGESNLLDSCESTFSAYIEDRRQNPRSDVLTHLAEARFPDGTVPDTSVLANEAAFLFAAGQETTARSLASAVQRIGLDPALQEGLRRDHDEIPDFIEEILRLESPVKDHFRMTRRTTTLGGVTLPAGTTVMVMIGAANRDPAVFDRPDEVRLDRPHQREHIAFAGGPHSCLGRQLARSEMRIAIQLLLERTASIELSPEHHGDEADRRFQYEPTSLFRGLTELQLRFLGRPGQE